MSQALNNIRRSTAAAGKPAEASGFPALLEQYKGEIARALPKHINPDRMARIALTAFRMTPKLGECDPRSVFAAVVQSSQLGLEVGLMGEAHLVPFGSQCQLIPGYTGLMKLARQSGLVQDIYAHEVRANDKFTLKLGMERDLQHEPLTAPGGFPASDEERGEVVGFYAVGIFKDGSKTFVAMSRKEVEKVRDGSKGYQAAKKYKKDSPWDTDFVAMGLKTAIRRLCKWLPKSPELATALALDDSAGRQNLNVKDVIDGTFTPVIDEETGEIVDVSDGGKAANNGVQPTEGTPVAKPEPEVAPRQESKAKTSAKQSSLEVAIRSMEEAKTVEALDEVYIRAEDQHQGVELEILMQEYRRIKNKIGGLL